MRKFRSVGVLVVTLGMGVTTLLSPIAVGTAAAGQPPVAATATLTNTYVTDATWMATNGSGTSPAVVECPNSAWTANISGASWIWAPDVTSCVGTSPGTPGNAPAESVTFTKTFDVTGMPQGGTLLLAADNWASVTVNGTLVGGTNTSSVDAANFENAVTIDVTSALLPGSNTIAITGTNPAWPCSGDTCNPAGVLASLTVTSSLTSTASCKHGGWQNWADANGNPFKNQGDCVSYVVSHGNDPSNV